MDIDIDFPDRQKALDLIAHIPASIHDHTGIRKHNTGVYCHSIPIDPLTGNSSIDYKEAETRGYFKIDFLNVSIYKDIKDENHLIKLLEIEPLWELLEQKEFSDLLFHLNGHHAILQKMKPKSIPQLAAVLAMIRPAKRHLIGEPWDVVLKTIWDRPDNNEYHFKKSHSFSYAVAIVAQMNHICENVSRDCS
jgi:hypothetical protein